MPQYPGTGAHLSHQPPPETVSRTDAFDDTKWPDALSHSPTVHSSIPFSALQSAPNARGGHMYGVLKCLWTLVSLSLFLSPSPQHRSTCVRPHPRCRGSGRSMDGCSCSCRCHRPTAAPFEPAPTLKLLIHDKTFPFPALASHRRVARGPPSFLPRRLFAGRYLPTAAVLLPCADRD
ncbi:hypothetical protein LX36DRAFT_189695 [Colletotrichum falcatum]|nr:hypothetical protein LX36DRAFT_189695 [Colletotrichum falcatum]